MTGGGRNALIANCLFLLTPVPGLCPTCGRAGRSQAGRVMVAGTEGWLGAAAARGTTAGGEDTAWRDFPRISDGEHASFC